MRVEKQGDRQPFEPWEGPAPAAASGGTAIPVTSSVTGPSPPVASSGDADESPGPTSGVPCRPSEAEQQRRGSPASETCALLNSTTTTNALLTLGRGSPYGIPSLCRTWINKNLQNLHLETSSQTIGLPITTSIFIEKSCLPSGLTWLATKKNKQKDGMKYRRHKTNRC